jgi:hypothetical protein
MHEQYAEIIKEFPLFRGFTLHGAKLLLECGEVKEYSPGEVVLREGDSPTSSCWFSRVKCRSLLNARDVT